MKGQHLPTVRLEEVKAARFVGQTTRGAICTENYRNLKTVSLKYSGDSDKCICLEKEPPRSSTRNTLQGSQRTENSFYSKYKSRNLISLGP